MNDKRAKKLRRDAVALALRMASRGVGFIPARAYAVGRESGTRRINGTVRGVRIECDSRSVLGIYRRLKRAARRGILA